MTTTVTLSDAESGLKKLINGARRRPVTVVYNNRPQAVVVSVKKYKEYERLAELFEQAEDEYWGKLATAAQKEGFIGVKKSAKLRKEILGEDA